METVAYGSGEDDIGDKCVYHVQMEHGAGCAAFNFLPLKRVLGLGLILAGFVLTYLGRKATKTFMQWIV